MMIINVHMVSFCNVQVQDVNHLPVTQVVSYPCNSETQLGYNTTLAHWRASDQLTARLQLTGSFNT